MVRYHHHDFYLLLRWLLSGTSALTAALAARKRQYAWAWLAGMVAVLFNPLKVIALSQGTWTYVDIVVACFFLTSLVYVNEGRGGATKDDSQSNNQNQVSPDTSPQGSQTASTPGQFQTKVYFPGEPGYAEARARRLAKEAPSSDGQVSPGGSKPEQYVTTVTFPGEPGYQKALAEHRAWLTLEARPANEQGSFEAQQDLSLDPIECDAKPPGSEQEDPLVTWLRLQGAKPGGKFVLGRPKE